MALTSASIWAGPQARASRGISMCISYRAGRVTPISCPWWPMPPCCRRRSLISRRNSARPSRNNLHAPIEFLIHMSSETLHFENARLAQQLFNNDIRNLQTVEQELGVKVTARDGWIKLDGPPEAMERAKQLFTLLEESVKAGTPVRQREFAHALGIVKQEGTVALKEMLSDRIQASPQKTSVTPKTLGQK